MLWFADFETTTVNTEYFKKTQDTTLIVGAITNEWGEIYQTYTSLNFFIEYIIQNLKSDDILYFHNLSFDGDFIYKHLFKDGWKPVNTKEELRHKTIYIFRDLTNIYEIVLGWKNKRIQIHCSYKILCASIQALSKSLSTKEKASFVNDASFYDLEPVNNISELPPNFLEYLKNDIEVQRLAVLRYYRTIEEHFKDDLILLDVHKYMTSGSMSFALQKEFAKQELNTDEMMWCTPEEYDLNRKWFFGGLTQFNPLHQGKLVTSENGVCYDINSAYPYAMTKPLPITQLNNYNDKLPPENKPIYNYLHLYVKEAKAKYKSCPFLRNWKLKEDDTRLDSRYTLYLNNFECYYLEQEWEQLQKYYEFDFEIKNVYWAEVSPFLKDYVERLYFLKSEYKKNKDDAGGLAFKILLNSSYGKFAQKYNKKQEFWVPTKDKEQILLNGTNVLVTTKLIFPNDGKTKEGKYVKVKRDYDCFPVSKLIARDNVCGMSNIYVKQKYIKKAHNMLIAATVTALNRAYMLETIHKVGPDKFYYCDTDSIFFDNSTDLKDLDIDAFKLGAWDKELDFQGIIINGSKSYAVVDKDNKIIKSRFSGINTRYLKQFEILEWFSGKQINLEKANIKKMCLESGIVLVPSDYEIKKRKY